VLASLNHPHIAAVYGIEKGAAFEHGIPAPLFNVQTAGYFPYDIGPDGRFLINVPIQSQIILPAGPGGRVALIKRPTARSLSSGQSSWDKLKCQLDLILVQTAYSEGEE
jgi:hypothetical protein